MKFVVSSTDLLSNLEAISRPVNTNSALSILDEFLAGRQPMPAIFRKHYKQKLNSNEFNSLLRLVFESPDDLTLSQYETVNSPGYDQFLESIIELATWLDTDVKSEKPQKNNYSFFYSGSTRQLLHNLAVYIGHELSTLFRVLRNTLIHSLSIFFGLCCSCSGYIFDAISGTSTHPVPSSL